MRHGTLFLLCFMAVNVPSPCQAGEQATAAAKVTGGFVSEITLISGGSGYMTAPAVRLTGGGGSGASAKAFINGGTVSLVLVLAAGSGYSSPPVVAIDPPPPPAAQVELASELVPVLTLRGRAKSLARVEYASSVLGPWVAWTNVYVGEDGAALVDLRPEVAARFYRSAAVVEIAHENSLGMLFAPVPGTGVFFSLWETRVRDYADYAFDVGDGFGAWRDPIVQTKPVTPGPPHPVVNVSLNEARGFCQWLTNKERREGRLTQEQSYRLPTDAEWSWAVGIGNLETGATPKDKSGKLPGLFPWGDASTPLRNAGNYQGSFAQGADIFERTSPVGSFQPNAAGLFDMGGNVWEWCDDTYELPGSMTYVVRGASWMDSSPTLLLSSFRSGGTAVSRNSAIGFRCVLVGMPVP